LIVEKIKLKNKPMRVDNAIVKRFLKLNIFSLT
jgi:hypothetical protein